MRVEERPLVFDCEGCELIGIVHIPETPRPVGLLAVAAGGIQYRGGCGRQLVSMARQLAAQGFPVLRFDHRGHGDSDGALLGFRHMDEDLARAVQVFRDNVPSLTHVSMFGGCEAASAIMMSGLGLPAVRLSAVFVADLLGLRVARQGAVQFSASREARLAWVRRTRRANGSRRISRSVDLAPTTATGLATRERWRWAKIRSGARTSETSESP